MNSIAYSEIEEHCKNPRKEGTSVNRLMAPDPHVEAEVFYEGPFRYGDDQEIDIPL